MTTMPNRKAVIPKVRPSSAKEVSVMAWIQDAFGHVLLVQQTAGEKLWALPGGKVRSNEGLKQALRRELKEEIGLSLVSAQVIDMFDRPQRTALAVCFRVTLRKGTLKLGAPEIKDAAFVSKLPSNATPSVKYFWNRQFPAEKAKGHNLEL